MSYYALTFSNLRPFDLGQVSILRVSGEDGQAPRRAIEALRQGRVVVYPTDTVYGLGCRIDDEGAVQRIFAIKRRPPTEAVPVVLAAAAPPVVYARGGCPAGPRAMAPARPGG